MSYEINDRISLLRISEQVEKIYERLGNQTSLSEQIIPDENQVKKCCARCGHDGIFDRQESRGAGSSRAIRPPLPDPRLIRRIIQQRQLRARYFDGELFGDPAWDILLDLAAARVEHKRVSVTSLCIASNVPPTTALRWITMMVDSGLLERIEDDTDRRRAFVTLTEKASDAIARYFFEVGQPISVI